VIDRHMSVVWRRDSAVSVSMRPVFRRIEWQKWRGTSVSYNHLFTYLFCIYFLLCIKSSRQTR